MRALTLRSSSSTRPDSTPDPHHLTSTPPSVVCLRATPLQVTFHVMSDWVDYDLTPADVPGWMRYFYPMRAPLECATRLLRWGVVLPRVSPSRGTPRAGRRARSRRPRGNTRKRGPFRLRRRAQPAGISLRASTRAPAHV